MKIQTQKTISILLAIAGAAGVVVTTILTRKAAVKENDILEKNKSLGVTLTNKDKINVFIKTYTPVLVVGTATIASIVTSTIIGKKTEASLGVMAIFAQQGWSRYNRQIKETLGVDKHVDVLKDIAKKELNSVPKSNITKNDGKELFFEEHIGFFRSRTIDILAAYTNLNQRLLRPDGSNKTRYFTTLGLFLKDSKADIVKLNNKKGDYIDLGWSYGVLMIEKESKWIDMTLTDAEEDGVKYKVISWKQEPTYDISKDDSTDLDYSTNDKDVFTPMEVK